MKQAFPQDVVPQEKLNSMSEEQRAAAEAKLPESSLPTSVLTEVPEYIDAKRIYEAGYDTLKACEKGAGDKPDYTFADSSDVGDHFRIQIGKTLDEFKSQLAKDVSAKVNKYSGGAGGPRKVHAVADASGVPALKDLSQDQIRVAVQEAVAAIPEATRANLGRVYVTDPKGNLIVVQAPASTATQRTA